MVENNEDERRQGWKVKVKGMHMESREAPLLKTPGWAGRVVQVVDACLASLGS
jgi:hypothetical protein